ncbi:hypothetical protein BOV90_04930 [Solemya velum gill symbiont]|uniref:Peptidase S54 rhomboid domain-containing protein n=1 Tax=Solemya velum gill symbiont TaxID=2340 RepID=A0A1T2CZN0_SOVGS|nr:hypothetical protein [Solemya velum gill symbiont]OOY34260.1 hypothetical protein BOV88_10850 [Solemya velum gill symbiont]OOY37033.1 hypothetical protein BOV89_09420 [Solemya velum gill symbiont]OOY40250.1 hypothetical protein BOV90_04930 [Solemya velum gill symbiont]OOY41455.1 hypothetical protein BOV91_11385 [Solemya velum gill symbiont]OOY46317.1 hypothetical protein BOV92_03380 [Solemya velum gill symbiont]
MRDKLIWTIAATLTLFITLQLVHIYELDLRYIASSVDKGVLWRLFSGHLIHGNWWHLALNAAGLVACLLLFRDLENPLLLLVLSLILAFLISVQDSTIFTPISPGTWDSPGYCMASSSLEPYWNLACWAGRYC